MTRKNMRPVVTWTGLGLLAALTVSIIFADRGTAQQTEQSTTGMVSISDVVSRMSKESGLTILTDSTLKMNVPPLKSKTTPGNVEAQIRALIKTLPPGTIWGKLYLPVPRTGSYKGDDVAAFAFASGQLFGPVGSPEPPDTVEIMGKRLPAESARDILDRLKLKPVYLLSNPRLGRNGFLVEGPANGPQIAVNPVQAAATAIAAQPGTVSRVEMGYEKGLPVYQFDVAGADGRKYEVRVNGNTGEILSNRPD